MIIDLHLNAPHITCSVVMRGWIGTCIVLELAEVQTGSDLLGNDEFMRRRRLAARVDEMSDQELQIWLPNTRALRRMELVPLRKSATERVRREPENANRREFYKSLAEEVRWSRS